MVIARFSAFDVSLKCCPSFLVQQITMVHRVTLYIKGTLGSCKPAYLSKASWNAHCESWKSKMQIQHPESFIIVPETFLDRPLIALKRQQGNIAAFVLKICLPFANKILLWRFCWEGIASYQPVQLKSEFLSIAFSVSPVDSCCAFVFLICTFKLPI